jgi:hypothetical protein
MRSGPARFAWPSWRRGERLELEPNPYFSPKPKLARLIVEIVPDQSATFNALRTHQLDIGELNTDNVEDAAHTGGLLVKRTAENGIRALYLQTAAAPTNDPHVRRAIAYAIDRGVLAKAWRGVYPPARSLFAAPLVSWPNVPPAPYPFDLVRAGRELDAAGWERHGTVRSKDGRPLALLVALDPNIAVVPRIAVIVQEQLARLGAEGFREVVRHERVQRSRRAPAHRPLLDHAGCADRGFRSRAVDQRSLRAGPRRRRELLALLLATARSALRTPGRRADGRPNATAISTRSQTWCTTTCRSCPSTICSTSKASTRA